LAIVELRQLERLKDYLRKLAQSTPTVGAPPRTSTSFTWRR
jgi:hypothetical protein